VDLILVSYSKENLKIIFFMESIAFYIKLIVKNMAQMKL